jgi:uncharacterized protein (DUF849 family)
VTTRIRRIQACLNGSRGRAEHPSVPVTPAELAADAVAVLAAGAEAVHLHPRGPDGTESMLAEHVGAAITAVRSACPGVNVGVTTGLWIASGDEAARLRLVSDWAGLPGGSRPDFASVNLSEPGAAGLIAVLGAAGIGAEAGVWSVSDAQAAASVSPGGWLRILIEIPDMPAGAAREAAGQVIAELDQNGIDAPRLLHGESKSCWPLVELAGELGLPTRIGLEDTLEDPAGYLAAGNAELLEEALSRWTAG